MESYSGSSEALPSEDPGPERRPERCTVCGSQDPRWWYGVEPVTDGRGAHVGPVAFARWWAACDDCGGLIDRQAVPALAARFAAGPTPLPEDVVREFAARARLRGPV